MNTVQCSSSVTFMCLWLLQVSSLHRVAVGRRLFSLRSGWRREAGVQRRRFKIHMRWVSGLEDSARPKRRRPLPRKRYRLIPQTAKYCLLSSLLFSSAFFRSSRALELHWHAANIKVYIEVILRDLAFVPAESLGLFASRCSSIRSNPPHRMNHRADLRARNSKHQNKSEPQKLIKRLFGSWLDNHSRTGFRRPLTLSLPARSLSSLQAESSVISLSPFHPAPPTPHVLLSRFLSGVVNIWAV